MLEVSDAWKKAYTEMLSPETFVEVTLRVGKELDEMKYGDNGYNDIELAYRAANDWVVYNPDFYTHHIHQTEPMPDRHAITLEENLWVLDGTCVESWDDEGRVESYKDWILSYSIHFGLLDGRRSVSALTIVWSTEYNEYPINFEILTPIPMEGEGKVTYEKVKVTGNKSVISVVDLNLTEVGEIIINVLDWNTPNHLKRIDQIYFGRIVVVDKNDIVSFSHEESCDLLSASLPKSEIAFSVSNIDGRWDPNNPKGSAQHLMDQQKVTVRYGTDINGVIEWIPGGTFFLSEWYSSPDGLEFSFVARDVIDRITKPKRYGVSHNSSLTELLTYMMLTNDLDEYNIAVDVGDNDFTEAADGNFLASLSGAANLQLLANYLMRVFYHDRRNRLVMKSLDKTICDYPMSLDYAYSYPKITLSKPLRNVVLRYYSTVDGVEQTNDYIALEVGREGEDQIIDNRLLHTAAAVSDINSTKYLELVRTYAGWVRDMLVSRKIISGEFRADPRLEVLDVVSIESKYGVVEPVALTTVKYTYNGSFRGYYEGRVL